MSAQPTMADLKWPEMFLKDPHSVVHMTKKSPNALGYAVACAGITGITGWPEYVGWALSHGPATCIACLSR